MSKYAKTLILFPKDSSTIFLEEVVVHLFAVVHESLFTFVRIEPSDESHILALKQVKDVSHDTILFLGHGTSSTLHGTCEKDYRNEKFISTRNFSVFNGKKILLVSCDSHKLIMKVKESGYSEAIGFGDLPTDWNDILSAREMDVGAYKGFAEVTIESFRKCIVEIIKYSVADFLNNDLSFHDLFNLICLRINKRIAKYYTNNRTANLLLTDTLLRMKDEVIYFNNA